MARLILKTGREKSVLNRHPWVFSGAVQGVEGAATPGQVLDIVSSSGGFLARAFYNPRSQIAARILAFEPVEIDRLFFRTRLEGAIGLRRRPGGGGERLVNAEGDFLPGLIVDRYGPHLALKINALGMKLWQEDLKEILIELERPESIHLRSDPKADELEGMEGSAGDLWGRTPERVEIAENGIKFLVDVKDGQKTGFYLDQKINRQRVAAYAPGRRVLDLFCYSGGFGIAALQAGADSARFLDSSRAALKLLRENLSLNHLDKKDVRIIDQNVFTALPRLKEEEPSPSLVILDPPAMAQGKKDVGRAARGYHFLNARALELLSPGGILSTFSCSHHLDDKLFRQIVWEAALSAGREAQVIEELSAAPDHPVSVCHPEGEYLKGLILRVR